MIIQVIILILSAAAIWFVTRKEKWARWGYVCGILGQPFWLYSSYHTEQWGIFCLSLFYLYSWGQGFYNYWWSDIKKLFKNETI